jgi:hypothetical protein
VRERCRLCVDRLGVSLFLLSVSSHTASSSRRAKVLLLLHFFSTSLSLTQPPPALCALLCTLPHSDMESFSQLAKTVIISPALRLGFSHSPAANALLKAGRAAPVDVDLASRTQREELAKVRRSSLLSGFDL